MVPFALGHLYAFSHHDYDESRLSARVPLIHSLRDAFGVNDIIQDSYHTFKGTPFRGYTDINQSNERQAEDGEGQFVLDKNRSRHVHRKLRKLKEYKEQGDEITPIEFLVEEELEGEYNLSREVGGDYGYPVIIDMKTEMEIQEANKKKLAEDIDDDGNNEKSDELENS